MKVFLIVCSFWFLSCAFKDESTIHSLLFSILMSKLNLNLDFGLPKGFSQEDMSQWFSPETSKNLDEIIENMKAQYQEELNALKLKNMELQLKNEELQVKLEALKIELVANVKLANLALDEIKNLCQDKKRTVEEEQREDRGGLSVYHCVYVQKAYVKDNICHYEPEVEENCGFIRRVKGCVLGGTLYTMEDGTLKEVSQISRGDRTWNPYLKKGYTVTNVFVGPEKKPMIRITVSSDLTVTQNHPMFVNGELKKACDMKWSDQLMQKDSLRKMAMTEVTHNEPVFVYNIEVDGGADWHEHLVEANGIVTGDMYVQRMLE